MSGKSWSQSLQHLRELHDDPSAQASAVVLAGACGRWHRAVEVRTSIQDLLFTLPSDDGHPGSQNVRVRILPGGRFVLRWESEGGIEERTADAGQVDGILATFLERLTSPIHSCTSCGEEVLVSAQWFETFERMHWTCFHYEFEHEPFDRDEECVGGGCPSAAVDPWHVLNDPRDALVGQLLDDLRTGDLAAETDVVQVEREGPGVISARFDDDRYRVTVRRVPRRPERERRGSNRD